METLFLGQQTVVLTREGVIHYFSRLTFFQLQYLLMMVNFDLADCELIHSQFCLNTFTFIKFMLLCCLNNIYCDAHMGHAKIISVVRTTLLINVEIPFLDCVLWTDKLTLYKSVAVSIQNFI